MSGTVRATVGQHCRIIQTGDGRLAIAEHVGLDAVEPLAYVPDPAMAEKMLERWDLEVGRLIRRARDR